MNPGIAMIATELLREEHAAATRPVGKWARKAQSGRRQALRWALNALLTGRRDERPGAELEEFLEGFSTANPGPAGWTYKRELRAVLYDDDA